ncbi:hypothetical protein CVU83_01765 [Candidatus Falkowbacteria bacterium HGW-Falkowbacteria-2]|uniref:Uncharacterized protein n=1 Tax=Candidatus Falkowbacteria bacterium HGW-Falkowbacteria-2 TaxID=2013769 RepID=A0A2N2E112_9BACT|nr:MAG: hypothetical protein CVU83_01765 [Candidatus Falkowbacteria bacterium HGW-Falkowbacteria-2]
MALQLQLVYTKADEQRNQLAILKHSIKDQLESLQEYQEVIEDLEALRLKKKKIIENVLADNKKDVDEIDRLTLDLKSQKQLISDVALKDYLDGKKVEVVKANGAILEPVFSVKFIKTGEYIKPEKTPIPERLNLE